MNHLIKLANNFSAWMAGMTAGQEDVAQNSWSDPRASWRSWRHWMETEGTWDKSLDNSFDSYESGYRKALILNNGMGMPTPPEQQEIAPWEDFEFPFGENRSKLPR